MKSNVGCWRRPLAVLVIAMSWLTGCATVGSDIPPGTCPPVVEYSRAEQMSVAAEVAALPDGAMIVGWLPSSPLLGCVPAGISSFLPGRGLMIRQWPFALEKALLRILILIRKTSWIDFVSGLERG